VARIDRESSSVVSLLLEPVDARPLTVPLPGQFVVLRLCPKADAPPVLRSYSLSDLPDGSHYRITIKEETHGVASTYLSTQLRIGDVLDVSAPRGAFILRRGNLPVVLLSAGIGVTPVMAMLHALASHASPRPVWWIYGARNRPDHPFAREARDLLAQLPHARSYVQYSRPDSTDRVGDDFDAAGRLTVTVLKNLGVPRNADFYLCGPPTFLEYFTAGLDGWGVARVRLWCRESFTRFAGRAGSHLGSAALIQPATRNVPVKWSTTVLREGAYAIHPIIEQSCTFSDRIRDSGLRRLYNRAAIQAGRTG
jgi:ferredoxin-NADP reductase